MAKVVIFMVIKDTLFFNKKSLLHAIIVLSSLAVIDFFLYFYDLENSVSISFYLKVVTCVAYALAVKNEGFKSPGEQSLECALHIVTAACGIWIAGIYYVAFNQFFSKFVGAFLIFGLFGLFNIIVELSRKLNQDAKNSIYFFKVCLVFMKLMFFVLMIISIVFLFFGDWSWNIKPFYEW